MSRLKLFWPGGAQPEDRLYLVDDGEPAILSFPANLVRLRGRRMMNPVTRARVIHKNSRCPNCRHPAVEPIELGDGLLNRDNVPVPGTATLVGFHCEACRAEWPL